LSFGWGRLQKYFLHNHLQAKLTLEYIALSLIAYSPFHASRGLCMHMWILWHVMRGQGLAGVTSEFYKTFLPLEMRRLLH
jgi:hypothetical protein